MRLVLEALFGMTMTDVYSGKVSELSAEEETLLREIAARLQKEEPVQYVLGQSWFCGRALIVRPGVLIPRPETEDLCRWIEADANGRGGLRILDVGTGSGCIAVTLSLDISGASVEAWDISEQAMAVARANCRKFGAEVLLRRQDIMTATASDGGEDEGGRYDIIVSNPPYVLEKERSAMSGNVLRWEPEEALFVPDDDPLRFYRPIAAFGKAALRSGGSLYLEINPLQSEALKAMLGSAGYSDIEVREDRFGRARMIKAIRK